MLYCTMSYTNLEVVKLDYTCRVNSPLSNELNYHNVGLLVTEGGKIM